MRVAKSVFLLIVVLFFPIICSATTYYVDSVGGLDSNNGYSVSTPWKTIAKVNATAFSPGDSILFKAGGRWRENLVPPSSGTVDKPIRFGMYGTGDKPIIEGKASYQYAASQWTNAGTNIWKSTFNGANGYPSMASIGGKALNKAVTWSEFGQARPFYHESASSGMYNVYIYSTVNPSQAGEVWVWGGGTQLNNIKISSKSYLIIENLNLRHAGWYNIFIQGGDHITIDNCILHGSPQNFGVQSLAKYITLKNSVVSEADWGMYIGASDNVQIINNDISGGRFAVPDLVGGEAGCFAPSVFQNEGDATNLLVEYNKIHDCESYAIAEYGYDANNRLENSIYRYNEIYDSWFGFWSMSMPSGVYNTKFYYNIIHSPKTKVPLHQPSMGSQKSSGIRMYRTNNSVYAYNNTIVDYPVGIEVAAADAFTAKNNIILNAQVNILNGTSSTTNVFNYNLYYPNKGVGSFSFNESSYDLVGWITRSGQDKNSISANPLLNYDYTLTAGSPAINTGTSVGLVKDYYGKGIVSAPDMGASEYNGTTVTPPPPPPTEPPPPPPPTEPPTPPPVTYYYSVGGTVSGLVNSSLTLTNNGADPIILQRDGSFVFTKLLSGGSSYNVTVAKQPAGQICRVSNGTGRISTANITNVNVVCTRKNNRK